MTRLLGFWYRLSGPARRLLLELLEDVIRSPSPDATMKRAREEAARREIFDQFMRERRR